MIKKTQKEVKELKEIVTAYVCDVCGKEHPGSELSEEWHEFSHSHGGWGNDSVDSYESFQVCSVICYAKQIRESVEEVGGYADARIDEMSVPFAKAVSEAILKG